MLVGGKRGANKLTFNRKEDSNEINLEIGIYYHLLGLSMALSLPALAVDRDSEFGNSNQIRQLGSVQVYTAGGHQYRLSYLGSTRDSRRRQRLNQATSG